MARALRVEYEGAFYHVTSRGNDRKRIFFNKTDYSKFKAYLEEGIKKFGYKLHAYVLMSNHYHLLIETPNSNISKIMHYLNSSYTTYINIKRDRSGHLFQGRYKSILVQKDNYLLELSRYIHLNPVKAGIVEKPQDYLHSSYMSYIEEKNNDIVYKELVLSMMANKMKQALSRYRSFVEGVEIDKLKNPLKDVYGGFILGTKAFIKQTLDILDDIKLEKNETSHRTKLRKTVEPEDVIKAVSNYLAIPADELLNMKGEIRGGTVYFLKIYTDMSNNEIGKLFDGLSYSAVSKIKQRFISSPLKDRSLKNKIKKMHQYLSNVKG
jgi:putative transposase